MVYIAGKPIIGHILDRMIELEPEEVILIVGYHKEQLISYVSEHYNDKFNIRYVEQEKRLGLGHSVYVTKDYVTGSDVMIALGDMIFQSGYLEFYTKHSENEKCAGSIGVRKVEEPKKYGIVELEKSSSCIRKLEEKPEIPKSNLGIAGVYFINETQLLFDILEKMMKNNIRSRGEYQLTDALQEMINQGAKLKVFEVSSWYDCGHANSLLETNQVLLDEKEIINSCNNKDSVIIHPVSIGRNVKLVNSIIGPHASIAENTVVESSIISNSVIGSRSHISYVNLQSSIVGDDANVVGKHNSLNIGDSSSIEF
jgi:glucose-1-phosphate thymidylyltransferase